MAQSSQLIQDDLPTSIINKIFSYMSCAEVERIGLICTEGSNVFDASIMYMKELILSSKKKSEVIIKLIEGMDKDAYTASVCTAYNVLYQIFLELEILYAKYASSRNLPPGVGIVVDYVIETINELENFVADGKSMPLHYKSMHLKFMNCLKHYPLNSTTIGVQIYDLLDILKGSSYVVKIFYKLMENVCEINAKYSVRYAKFLAYILKLPSCDKHILNKNDVGLFMNFLTSLVLLHNVLKTREDNYSLQLNGAPRNTTLLELHNSREIFQRKIIDLQMGEIEETFRNIPEADIEGDQHDFYCEVYLSCAITNSPVKIRKRFEQLMRDMVTTHNTHINPDFFQIINTPSFQTYGFNVKMNLRVKEKFRKKNLVEIGLKDGVQEMK